MVAVMTPTDWLQLEDDSRLLVVPNFLSPRESGELLALLVQNCQWEQKPAVFGHLQPRLTAACGDPGLTYRYSRTQHTTARWLPEVLQIRDRLEQICGRYNFCLLNRYRDGRDSMGWHADDEPEMGPVIASLSVGAERRFRLRHNSSRRVLNIDVTGGMLIIMAGEMQKFWQHELPRMKRCSEQRINLTFRELIQNPQKAT